MAQLRIHGVPDGSLGVSAAQNGQNASATPTIVKPPAITSPHQYFVRTNNPNATSRTPTLATTVGEFGNGENGLAGFYAPVFRQKYSTTVAHANRLITPNMDDNEYTKEIFIGGMAEIYRITNGVYDLVRTSTIIGGSIGKWNRLSSKEGTTGLSFEWKFSGWNARNREIWYGVAAVGADGKMGPVSYVAYTATHSGGSAMLADPLKIDFTQTHGGSLAAPANFALTPETAGSDNFTLSWDAVAGATKYAVVVMYNEDPATTQEEVAGLRYYELENDGGVPILAGDFFIMTKRQDFPTNEVISTRVYWDNATTKHLKRDVLQQDFNSTTRTTGYREWAGDKPDAALGTMYGESIVKPNQTRIVLLQTFWNGGVLQYWYQGLVVGREYEISFWIYADTITDVRLNPGIQGFSNEFITLAVGWQKITRKYTPLTIRNNAQPYAWSLEAESVGASPITFRFAAARAKDTNSAFTEFTLEDAATIPAGIFIRDHSNVNTWSKCYDITALTNPAGESPVRATIDSLWLKAIQTNTNPWHQIEMYLSLSDFSDFLAYINAPVSSGHPMALKRQAQGRTAPWTDSADKILLEISNETWNSLPNFWGPPPGMTDSATAETYNQGAIYGLLLKRIADHMEADPHWSNKIEWVIGGKNGSLYGADAARTFGKPCHVGIAAYNGGWDVGGLTPTESDASYTSLLQNKNLDTGPNAIAAVNRLKDLANEAGSPYTYGVNLFACTYESGPGYNLSGLNGASLTKLEDQTQEFVMKSFALGTATLDTFLMQAAAGNSLMNYFVTGDKTHWANKSGDWASGETLASWELNKIIHEAAGEYTINDAYTIKDPQVEVTLKDLSTRFHDRLAVYFLESITYPNRKILVVLNLSITDANDITIMTGMASATSCKVWRHTQAYNHSNHAQIGFRVDENDVKQVDPLSSSLDLTPVNVTVPADMSRIVIDNNLSGVGSKLTAGGALIIQFDGVV